MTIEFAAFSKSASTIDPKNFGPKLDEFQEPRFLEQVKLFFDRAASKTDVPQEYLNLIKACNTVIRFNIPLRRDNGTVETVTCYRYVSDISPCHLSIERFTLVGVNRVSKIIIIEADLN
jgi:hypothetical protein